jgi:hypothetical protein
MATGFQYTATQQMVERTARVRQEELACQWVIHTVHAALERAWRARVEGHGIGFTRPKWEVAAQRLPLSFSFKISCFLSKSKTETQFKSRL